MSILEKIQGRQGVRACAIISVHTRCRDGSFEFTFQVLAGKTYRDRLSLIRKRDELSDERYRKRWCGARKNVC